MKNYTLIKLPQYQYSIQYIDLYKMHIHTLENESILKKQLHLNNNQQYYNYSCLHLKVILIVTGVSLKTLTNNEKWIYFEFKRLHHPFFRGGSDI